jgi:hypothetical protein
MPSHVVKSDRNLDQLMIDTTDFVARRFYKVALHHDMF